MIRGLMLMLSVLLLGNVATTSRLQQPERIDVYKDPTCTCCSKWAEHLRTRGFSVETTDSDKVDELKTRHRVPRQLRSCHTALVAGYVIEGHVPAGDVQRLLEERPSIRGLAVAGMPIGSPGMEVTVLPLPVSGMPKAPGNAEPPSWLQPQPYDVVAFDDDGGTRIFATHGR